MSHLAIATRPDSMTAAIATPAAAAAAVAAAAGQERRSGHPFNVGQQP